MEKKNIFTVTVKKNWEQKDENNFSFVDFTKKYTKKNSENIYTH